MRKLYLPLLAAIAVSPSLAATVEVDRYFQGSSRVDEIILPSQYKVVPIGELKAGDQIAVQIVAANKVYNDITACIATETEARAYSPRNPCRGFVKAATPMTLRDQVRSDDKYYLVLDNSYAAVIKKTLSVQISTRRTMSDEEVSRLKGMFEQVQRAMVSMFENADFNIFVRPCGQSNAFSNTRTADITVCSEFIHDMAEQRNQGALAAILLHEYGHSLLNRWGEPGSSEEDMADQFATAMLLRGGDNGRRLLQGWISFWQRRDSQAEATHQIERGDTHTLSIQRARNIQNSINYPEDFVRRWNKMFYRHMTRPALEQVLARPAKSDDLDLATEALRRK